jgi:hypothetical protein
MLTQIDKENIISEFPNIKLSYENITHNKVYNSDFIVAIPEGKKCFAWFTTVNDKMVCLIMELTDGKQIHDIKIANACFSHELGYGTILYGTLFYHMNNKFFSIEDIFSYKGNSVNRENWGNKLLKIKNILNKDLKQISYNNSFLVFGLPLMCKNNDELCSKIENNIKYKISSIQYKLFNKVNNYLFMDYDKYKKVKNFKERNEGKEMKERTEIKERKNIQNISIKTNNKISYLKKDIIFLVRPDIQNDIYYLFCLNDNKEEQYSIAHIPDYNTSVMMNKLFRIIKENDNLDALEESDDEDEFQNENIDRFVHLNKSYKMYCQYNYKFKKWVPIKVADENSQIINMKDLKIYV